MRQDVGHRAATRRDHRTDSGASPAQRLRKAGRHWPAADSSSSRNQARPAHCIGYPRMSASGESSTMMHRLLHASGSHPIPPPNDLKTNQYNQDLGLIHSTNGNHLESPNEGSSIDHQRSTERSKERSTEIRRNRSEKRPHKKNDRKVLVAEESNRNWADSDSDSTSSSSSSESEQEEVHCLMANQTTDDEHERILLVTLIETSPITKSPGVGGGVAAEAALGGGRRRREVWERMGGRFLV
ncbi:alpha-taxilin [Dorcoceras hygrometricum]|uniref:Alpha-taxilin n=1 Tax=Dorcoceras hygrometricum TaxID=472368 RepID=A0A2Z7AFT2_9LAMI|nr:alpha-taxilin [Dorcoceras hygrometricum]